MDHFPTNWGRPRNDAVDAYNTYPLHSRPVHHDSFADGVQRTQQPIVTGTSVLAIRYKDGVMMAADTLASYGSLARFKDVTRLHAVGDYTILGAGGDMSDFQYLKSVLNDLIIDEFTQADGHALGPSEIFEVLSGIMYGRRSKFNPLWNSLLVGGFKDGKSFLAYVDLLGTTYKDNAIATGYGAYIALPLLREIMDAKGPENISEEEARSMLTESMKVLFYRDARSLNKFQIGKITATGVEISDAISVPTEWAFAEKIRGYGAQTQ
ncbi:hypothetical protein M422DRAFT_69290 [Sphaerobolus stellatus SS14]|uniref:Proteasome subunit beta n=1 Tax=Sphaerobolus stellatus (strain SS14) TaxID=990650 RepID=A0A0C9V7P6_SPHS4|nr:hypothetical protein M422DRAFT_69290 [Sphaerobolus stellatus SS14]